jgi:hypothetical protein
MRSLLIVIVFLVLAGCARTGPYSSQDLRDVRTAYDTIRPILLAFESSYFRHNSQGILSGYHREMTACKLADRIDKRDSIDPNVKLFEASADLDNMCNDMDSTYTLWAKSNGYPYDKTVTPALPGDVFKSAEKSMKEMGELLRHPASLQ